MSSIAGSGCERIIPEEAKKTLEEIERSIVKRYRKPIWSKFIKAVKDYQLIEEGDKIAVAISGGKDSLLMAKLFQELKKHGQVNFDVEFIAMDPGYHPQIKDLLIENCEHLNIPVHIYESKIFENDPFAKLDQNGVGKLMEMTIKLGRPVNPNLHIGICGEHGGDPSSVAFCHKIGLDYVSCSPFRVPIARLAAAQAAIAEEK